MRGLTNRLKKGGRMEFLYIASELAAGFFNQFSEL